MFEATGFFSYYFYTDIKFVRTSEHKPTPKQRVAFLFVGFDILSEIFSFASNCRVNLVKSCLFAIKSVTVGILYGCHKTIKISLEKKACSENSPW